MFLISPPWIVAPATAPNENVPSRTAMLLGGGSQLGTATVESTLASRTHASDEGDACSMES